MKATNTFTQVPNSLLEALYTSKLTAAELRVMLFIIRQTCGYHRHSHELSAGFIAKGTNVPHRTVQRAVSKLYAKDLIEITSQFGVPNVLTLTAAYAQIDVGTQMTYDANDAGYTSPVTQVHTSPMAYKEIKKIKSKESVSPTLDDVIEYCHEMCFTFDAERFFNHYEAIGWRMNGQPIVNWKAVARNWQARERIQPVVEEVEKDDWGRPIPPKYV